MAEPNVAAGRALSVGIGASSLLIGAGLLLPYPEGAPLARLGLLILIATPAARVAALCASYARAKEWRYAAAGAAVLALMALGAALGRF